MAVSDGGFIDRAHEPDSTRGAHQQNFVGCRQGVYRHRLLVPREAKVAGKLFSHRLRDAAQNTIGRRRNDLPRSDDRHIGNAGFRDASVIVQKQAKSVGVALPGDSIGQVVVDS